MGWYFESTRAKAFAAFGMQRLIAPDENALAQQITIDETRSLFFGTAEEQAYFFEQWDKVKEERRKTYLQGHMTAGYAYLLVQEDNQPPFFPRDPGEEDAFTTNPPIKFSFGFVQETREGRKCCAFSVYYLPSDPSRWIAALETDVTAPPEKAPCHFIYSHDPRVRLGDVYYGIEDVKSMDSPLTALQDYDLPVFGYVRDKISNPIVKAFHANLANLEGHINPNLDIFRLFCRTKKETEQLNEALDCMSFFPDLEPLNYAARLKSILKNTALQKLSQLGGGYKFEVPFKELKTCLDEDSHLYHFLTKKLNDYPVDQQTHWAQFYLWLTSQGFQNCLTLFEKNDNISQLNEIKGKGALKEALANDKRLRAFVFLLNALENPTILSHIEQLGSLEKKEREKLWENLYHLSELKLTEPVLSDLTSVVFQAPDISPEELEKFAVFFLYDANFCEDMNNDYITQLITETGIPEFQKNYLRNHELLGQTLAKAVALPVANETKTRVDLQAIFQLILLHKPVYWPSMMKMAISAIKHGQPATLPAEVSDEMRPHFQLIIERIALLAELKPIPLSSESVIRLSAEHERSKFMRHDIKKVDTEMAAILDNLTHNLQKSTQFESQLINYKKVVYTAIINYHTDKNEAAFREAVDGATTTMLTVTDVDSNKVARVLAAIVYNVFTLIFTAGTANYRHMLETGDFLFFSSTGTSEKIKAAGIKLQNSIAACGS